MLCVPRIQRRASLPSVYRVPFTVHRTCLKGSQGPHSDASDRESGDSSSDSYDESSDDGRGPSEAVQHLEEVYRRILEALHKTAKIMCTGYVKAVSEIQPIVNAAVQEAVQPNKAYIQSTTGHLSEWGQALHDKLNSTGASAEEREAFSRAARLAGLKCVRSLLSDGEAFNAAEEQDIEKRLHDTVQAALKVANRRAHKTLEKVNKTRPEDHPEVCAGRSGRDLLGFGAPGHGEHYLSMHGMVMSQVLVPFHIARGTYFTSGNMFQAINNVVPVSPRWPPATKQLLRHYRLPAIRMRLCRSNFPKSHRRPL